VDASRCSSKRIDVEVCERLLHDPVRHRVDVATNNIEAEAVCFKERGASPHEWVADGSLKRVMLPKRFAQRSITTELCE